MRKIFAAGILGLTLGVAGATNPDDQAPEARAYFGFSFGGERIAPREFHYGLRLDHDSRFVKGPVAPLMQLDFTRRGFSAARINGLNVIRQQVRLQQAEAPEDTPAAPADDDVTPAEGAATEEPGFFSRSWDSIAGFFGGLFGGGDETDEPVEETAGSDAPEEVAAAEEVTEGTFLNYGVVDWGLLAVGAVGLGLVVGEISNGDESGMGGAGGLPGGLPGLPGGHSALASPYAGGNAERDAEYRRWLDGGTGQMGDLGGG